MKNAIRCCISCILPCGPLDVIRIVHIDGRVEEISGAVKASEIMKLHPKHVLRKPTSTPVEAATGKCSRIVVDGGIVSPEAALERGKIYFLIPLPEKTGRRSPTNRKKESRSGIDGTGGSNVPMANLIISDRYLREVLTERTTTLRRRSRAGVWRPRLASISETPAEV